MGTNNSEADELLDYLERQSKLTLPSAYSILTAVLPDPVCAIPDILPVGLAILGGRPKLGKSWLALQWALSIGTGGMAFGKKVQAGPVLYLALEDDKRRLQDRMRAQNWPVDPNLPVTFLTLDEFRKYIGFLHKNGAPKLKALIENEGYRMVVIDTFSRAFMGLSDVNDSQEVTRALSPIQEISLTCNCATLLLDHHTKPKGTNPNPIDDLMSSTAKSAVSDTLLGLYRENDSRNYRLKVIGRDIGEKDYKLTWDRLTCCWQAEMDLEDFTLNANQRAALSIVNQMGSATNKDISAATGLDTGNLWRDLQSLVALGLLKVNDKKEYLRP